MKNEDLAGRVTALEIHLAQATTAAKITAVFLLSVTGASVYFMPSWVIEKLGGEPALEKLAQGVRDADQIAAFMESPLGQPQDYKSYSLSRDKYPIVIQDKQVCVLSGFNVGGDAHTCSLDRNSPGTWTLKTREGKGRTNTCEAICFNLPQLPTRQPD